MGVDTKGFLATKEKNPFKIWKVIKASIIEDMMQTSGAGRQIDLWWKENGGYTCPKATIQDFSDGLEVVFEYKAEDRRMTVFTDCDGDYDDVYHGKKIILSLGYWGSSVHLIEVVLLGLKKEFGGQAYIVDDDCNDDWRKIKAS